MINISQATNRSPWERNIIRIGATTLFLVSLAGFIPSLYLYFYYGVKLSWQNMVAATIAIWTVYGAFYPIEPLTYYPSLGLAGTYMGWLAGNVGNMRVPAAAIARESLGVEDGTREADIVVIMSIAGSVVMNLVILTFGIFIGAQIMGSLPPIVRTALNSYLLPGIFGGMFGMYGTKYPNLAIPSFIVIVALNYMAGVMKLFPSWIVLFISVFGAIAFTRAMYKAGKV